jgi:hypothetical protein
MSEPVKCVVITLRPAEPHLLPSMLPAQPAPEIVDRPPSVVITTAVAVRNLLSVVGGVWVIIELVKSIRWFLSTGVPW